MIPTYIIIISVFILVIFGIHQWRKSFLKKKAQPAEWLPIINEFKMISPTIESTEEMEDYLKIINSRVVKFESDYDFHLAYYSIIQNVRERLSLDVKNGQ